MIDRDSARLASRRVVARSYAPDGSDFKFSNASPRDRHTPSRAMTTALPPDIRERFEEHGFDVPNDVARDALASVARALSFTSKDLADCWVMFDLELSNTLDARDRQSVAIERIETFERFAMTWKQQRESQSATKTAQKTSEFGRKRRRGGTPTTPTTPASAKGGDRRESTSTGTYKTPMRSKREWSEALNAVGGEQTSEYAKRAATPGSAGSLASRGDGGAGTVMNAHLGSDVVKRDDAEESEVSMTQIVSADKFRYMRDRISDRVRVVDERIRDAENLFEVLGDADDDEDVKATEATQTTTSASDVVRVSAVGSKTGDEDGHFVGRVVSAHAGDAKLTEKTVAIEGSTEGSFGARVRLELRDMKEYSLFPGQVVKVCGRNPAGHCLVAKSIDAVSARAPARSKKTSPAFARGTKVIVASGPFSCSSDLKYEPLNDMLDYVREENPDALVLCGPLVDAENAFVKRAECGGLTYDEVAKVVVDKIEDKLFKDETIRTKVIFVPSIRDVTLDPVFPQPAASLDAYVSADAARAKRAFSASNPGTFTINGIVFSACSHDVLKHLSAQEISKGFVPKDRLARLAKHVLTQGCAYPLYPPDASACLDARYGEDLTFKQTPDVLIMPSDLKTFAEDIDGVVCVNPGRLARGAVGGGLAKIVVHPTTDGQDDGESHPHDVAKRTRVDVMKIK